MRLHYLSVGVFLTGAVLFYSEGKIFFREISCASAKYTHLRLDTHPHPLLLPYE